MAFPKTLTAAGAESFGVLAAGDSVTDGGFFLSEDNLNSIESHLGSVAASASESQATIERLTTELATATSAQKVAEDALAAANTSVETIKADRDSWKKKAEEFGAKTDTPEQTGKKADRFQGGARRKNSMDAYAENMGVPRV
jgi:chromosome segregation ATPase